MLQENVQRGVAMSFKTETRKIRDIFQRSASYYVPRYQRQYVWSKTNWAELLNDIIFVIKNDQKEWSHFLGAIVLTNKTEQNKTEGKFDDSGIIEFEIVDGQQRLTTIYIILLCLHYLYKDVGSEQALKRANYLYNTYIISLDKDANPTIEIFNEDYSSDIRELVQCSLDHLFPADNNFFYDAFCYFYGKLKDYCFEDLDVFQNKLLDINIVEITSEQDEEIYNIFEVLNARGKKLKQMELLKNHIMKYIQPRTGDFIDKAKSKWNTIMENSNDLPDEDVLLAHFCKSYIKRKAENLESVYKLIKEEIDINKLSDFLESFVEYSECYKKMSRGMNSNNDIQYFDIRGIKQIRSLLASIEVVYKRGIICEEVKSMTIHQLRNFFFQFNACSYTSNKIDDVVASAAYNVYRSETEVDYKCIITRTLFEFSKYIQTTTVSTLLFSNSFLHYSTKNTSYKRNGKIVKYILFCIYSRLQKDTFLDQSKLTIEHLLNDDGSLEHSAIYNLTLTSGEINSGELKNKSIAEKIEILKEQSSVIENQQLGIYLENDIFLSQKRKDDMSKLILEEVFLFSPRCFHLEEEAVDKYLKYRELLRDDPVLFNRLVEKGVNFQIFLDKDPSALALKKRFSSIVGDKK